MQRPDVDRYLRRIGVDAAGGADLPTLQRLQRAHLETVPFENLDIRAGRALDLAEAALFEKIVVREPMYRHHQTSPSSHFTQRSICSRATPEGRLTLSDHDWIETRAGVKTRTGLADAAARERALVDHFGVVL